MLHHRAQEWEEWSKRVELQREICQELHRVDAVVVVRDPQRDQPVEESQQFWRGRRVLGPRDTCLTVGVEVVDKVDQIVGHVASSVHVEDVGSVDLL